MDPNETLRRIRALAERADATDWELYGELCELIQALDGWLSKDGFLPDAWQSERRATQELRAKHEHVIVLDSGESLLSHASSVRQKDYWDDVKGLADDVELWVKDQLKEGARGEALREGLIEYVHELVDGCSRVTYTYEAQETLLFSEHDGAAVEEGLVGPDQFKDGIPWSALAFEAVRQDLYEELDRRKKDVNEPDQWYLEEGTEDEDEAAAAETGPVDHE